MAAASVISCALRPGDCAWAEVVGGFWCPAIVLGFSTVAPAAEEDSDHGSSWSLRLRLRFADSHEGELAPQFVRAAAPDFSDLPQGDDDDRNVTGGTVDEEGESAHQKETESEMVSRIERSSATRARGLGGSTTGGIGSNRVTCGDKPTSSMRENVVSSLNSLGAASTATTTSTPRTDSDDDHDDGDDDAVLVHAAGAASPRPALPIVPTANLPAVTSSGMARSSSNDACLPSPDPAEFMETLLEPGAAEVPELPESRICVANLADDAEQAAEDSQQQFPAAAGRFVWVFYNGVWLPAVRVGGGKPPDDDEPTAHVTDPTAQQQPQVMVEFADRSCARVFEFACRASSPNFTRNAPFHDDGADVAAPRPPPVAKPSRLPSVAESETAVHQDETFAEKRNDHRRDRKRGDKDRRRAGSSSGGGGRKKRGHRTEDKKTRHKHGDGDSNAERRRAARALAKHVAPRGDRTWDERKMYFKPTAAISLWVDEVRSTYDKRHSL